MPPVPKKAAAAKKEVAGGSQSIEWRGLQFALPAVLSADAAWAIADINAANSNGSDAIKPVLDFIHSLLGDEQIGTLRAKLRDDQIPLDEFGDVIGELINLIFSTYGMAEGESGASE